MLLDYSGLVSSRFCSWSRVTGPKFGLDLKIRAQVLGIGFEIKIFQDRDQEQFLIRSHALYCISRFYTIFMQSFTYMGLRTTVYYWYNSVIAILLTEFNVIYEVVSQCIMMPVVYQNCFQHLQLQS